MKYTKLLQSAFGGGTAKIVDDNESFDLSLNKSDQITSNVNINLANNYWQR
ncbi:MAG: hypothetical protein PHI01_02010 [Candidatus Izemoplasmatales bacterium]|nr:hypothetical protein [Candidatus Izemoplasmatales bacterium]